MSILSKIDKAENLLEIVAFGKILPYEIYNTVRSHPERLQEFRLLFDLRFCVTDTHILFHDIEKCYKYFNELNFRNDKVLKIAIVASTDLWFMISKRYFISKKRMKTLFQMVSFRFDDEAIEWLCSK
jgi:hypothetical protein